MIPFLNILFKNHQNLYRKLENKLAEILLKKSGLIFTLLKIKGKLYKEVSLYIMI